MSERYYACLSREVREMGGRQRTGLEFEIVREEYLNFFLGRKNARMPERGDHEAVFENFGKYGIEHENFHKVKSRYLGTTGFYLLTVYFEDIEYARYRYENWYYIELADREHREELTGMVYDCAVCEWEETGDPVINAYGSFRPLGREETRLMRRLYQPYISVESRWDGSIGGNALQAIGAGTVFGSVVFYYVGAALCAEIFDNAGNPAAFFDLGTKLSNNPFLANQLPQAQNSRNAILGELGNIGPGNQMTIFISHWHSDHRNALKPFINNNVLAANIAGNTEWYVPGSGLPSFHTVQNSVPPGSFHVMAAGTAQASVNVNGNASIQVGKINFAGNPHPHHQGLYVKVVLNSGTTVFLAGDTTYSGMPAADRTNGGAGYTCLQVCHHGGDYHIAPAVAFGAQNFIPQAEQNALGTFVANAVYSADGIRYGHPNAQVVGDHRNRGYLQGNEFQLRLGAAAGFNILTIT